MTPDSFVHRYEPAKRPDAPTLLLLHGTGGHEDDLLDLGRGLGVDAHLLSPRGKVLENGMPRFFRRLAEGVFDLDDLRVRTHELADFVGEAAERYGFDAGRAFALGYSNGANIAATVMLLRPDVLRGGILLRPMVPLVPEPLPDLSHASVLIGAGRRDPIVRPEESERLGALLQQAGARVEASWHPGGHELGRADLEAMQRWAGAMIS